MNPSISALLAAPQPAADAEPVPAPSPGEDATAFNDELDLELPALGVSVAMGTLEGTAVALVPPTLPPPAAVPLTTADLEAELSQAADLETIAGPTDETEADSEPVVDDSANLRPSLPQPPAVIVLSGLLASLGVSTYKCATPPNRGSPVLYATTGEMSPGAGSAVAEATGEKTSMPPGVFLTKSPPDSPQASGTVAETDLSTLQATAANQCTTTANNTTTPTSGAPAKAVRRSGTVAAKPDGVSDVSPSLLSSSPQPAARPTTTASDLPRGTPARVLETVPLLQTVAELRNSAAWWSAPASLTQTGGSSATASTTVLPATTAADAVQALVEQTKDATSSVLPRRIEVPLSTAPGGVAVLHLTRAAGGEIRAQLGADSLNTATWLNQQIEQMRRSELGFAVRWLPAQIETRPVATREDSAAQSRREKAEARSQRRAASSLSTLFPQATPRPASA